MRRDLRHLLCDDPATGRGAASLYNRPVQRLAGSFRMMIFELPDRHDFRRFLYFLGFALQKTTGTIMPKVSVLMPAYNVEKYVAESIDSILNQTFTDFEFIIINDGSTDNTAKIIRQYSKHDKRIKFIDNKKNRGIISVRNQGLDLCTGKYIALIDSDDIALPHRLAIQVEYLDTHPNVGVVSGWIKLFGPDTHFEKIYKTPTNVQLLDLMHSCCVWQPAAMLRASVLHKHHIHYSQNYPYAEDYALWLQLCQHTQIHNIQEVLLNYRWHGTNVSIVHKQKQSDSTQRARRDTLTALLGDTPDAQKILNLTRELNQRVWLFGILPIFHRKQYGLAKTKYYLFEKIPLLRVQDGKIYLFEIIKIGKLN